LYEEFVKGNADNVGDFAESGLLKRYQGEKTEQPSFWQKLGCG
jgi:hypothetical protein